MLIKSALREGGGDFRAKKIIIFLVVFSEYDYICNRICVISFIERV